MTRPRRFLPPIAGGAQKTGWEALEKWVGSPSSDKAADEPSSPGGEASEGKKTGWEALDKWVGGGGGGAAAAPASETPAAAAETPAAAAEAPAGPSGKTGWEALDKWVGSGEGAAATPSAETSAANGAAGEQPVSASAPSSAPDAPAQGGFMGFLKRLFGGK